MKEFRWSGACDIDLGSRTLEGKDEVELRALASFALLISHKIMQ